MMKNIIKYPYLYISLLVLLSNCTNWIASNENKGGGNNGNNVTPKVETPVIEPSYDLVIKGQLVTITDATRGATIYYTEGDGSQAEPDPTTGTLYDPLRPIIDLSKTIKAKAYKNGYIDSDTATMSYFVSTIFAAGRFDEYLGAISPTNNKHISKLYSDDGSLDPSFTSGTGTIIDDIRAIAIQPSDQKIIIGGDFSTYNGTARNFIARVNTDGSLDTFFNPGTGADGNIMAMALQSDEKIIIGGALKFYDGTARNHIARVNTDGSLDTSFNPGMGASNSVLAVAIQPDRKILIGGSFMSYNGTARNFIARVNTDDGSLDTSFDSSIGVDKDVYAIAIQSDRKILIGGAFKHYGTTSRNYIARLNADGSLDTSFDSHIGADNYVRAIAIQSDGKVLIGGNFISYNGWPCHHIARLNTDGSLDMGFDSSGGADATVYAVAIHSDGRVLIGGAFTTYNGIVRNHIARLNTDGSLDNGFLNATDGFNNTVYSIVIGR